MILNCLFILYLPEQDSSLCLGERERTEKDRETAAYKGRYRETEMEMRERERERSNDIQTHTEAERKRTKRIDLWFDSLLGDFILQKREGLVHNKQWHALEILTMPFIRHREFSNNTKLGRESLTGDLIYTKQLYCLWACTHHNLATIHLPKGSTNFKLSMCWHLNSKIYVNQIVGIIGNECSIHHGMLSYNPTNKWMKQSIKVYAHSDFWCNNEPVLV